MKRILIVTGFILLIDLYVFQAYRSVFPNFKWLFYALYWGVTALVIIWILLAFRGTLEDWEHKYPYYTRIRAFIFIIYISKLFLLVPLIIDDLRRIISWIYQYFIYDATVNYWPERSDFLKKFGLILGAIPFLSLTYGMWNPFRFQKHRIFIDINDLPKEFEDLKIIQISDLHAGTFRDARPFQKAVDMINEEKPDLVFFTGDLVNNSADEMEDFVPVFSKIQSKYGVYSILGNHDYGVFNKGDDEQDHQEKMQDLFDRHEEMGWDLLLNESRNIKVNDHSLNILGVENYSAFSFFPKHGDLEKTWSNSEKADLNILLSHDPTHWDEQVITDYHDIDITLSGHTHGFQFGIEIPGQVKWSPSKWVYDRWMGLYKEGEQYLYVNRGLGCLGYPGRVGILPEISIINLKRSV